MKKLLIIYCIAKEKARLAFAAAINEIDENCMEVITSHSFVFESDKTPDEIFKLLIESGVGLTDEDEFFIFGLGKSFSGIGQSKDELKTFLAMGQARKAE